MVRRSRATQLLKARGFIPSALRSATRDQNFLGTSHQTRSLRLVPSSRSGYPAARLFPHFGVGPEPTVQLALEPFGLRPLIAVWTTQVVSMRLILRRPPTMCLDRAPSPLACDMPTRWRFSFVQLRSSAFSSLEGMSTPLTETV